MGFFINSVLLAVVVLSVIVALLCGFTRSYEAGAYFWGQAVTFLVILHWHTD